MSGSDFSQGNQFLRSGNWEAAVAAYRRAIAGNPEFYLAYHNLGEALEKLGRVNEAIAAFRQAAELKPDAIWSLSRLGELLRREERLEEAIVFLRRAVGLKPDIAKFNLSLGATLVSLGSVGKEADVYLHRAIELDPSLAEAFYYLGVAASVRQQPLEAIEFYTQSWELDNSAVKCGLALADTLSQLGRWEEAMEKIRQMEVISAKSGKLCFDRGKALGKLVYWKENCAENQLAEAEIDPDKLDVHLVSPKDYYYWANSFFNSGDWKKAIVYYRILLYTETELDFAQIHRQLGFALAKERHLQESVLAYRTALNLQSSVVGAYQSWKDFQDTEIYFFPDYRATNPYQNLLYSHPPEGCSIKAGDLDLVIQIIKCNLTSRKIVFHLHWTGFILAPAKTEEEAEQFKNSFLIKVFDFLLEGGVLIWTIHNTLPHDCRYRKQEIELRTILAVIANKIHLHSEKSVQEVIALFPLPLEKIQIAYMGNYIGCYPNYVSRHQSRSRWNLLPESIVFLFLGQIRPYKGLDDLIFAFSKIQEKYPNSYLLIAGNPSYPIKKGTTTAKAKLLKNIIVIEKHIQDDELQWYFGASDFVVLPFKNILTSSSVLGALSFGRPVIAPDVGMIEEIIQDKKNGFIYHLGDINSLEKAMLRAANLTYEERENLSKNSLKSVEKLTWNNHVNLLLSGLKRLKLQNNISLMDTKIRKIQNFNSANIVKEKIAIELEEIDCQIWNPLPPNKVAKVAIIILNYNTTDDLAQLVKSLHNSNYQEYNIFIVDNASTSISFQELIEKFSDLTIIRTAKNLGYAGGNNVGIQYIKKQGFEFIWILNPDTFVKTDSLESLVLAAQKHKEISIYGSVIFWKQQPEIVWSGGAVVEFKDSGFQTYHMYSGKHKSLIPDEIYDVDYVAGTSLFCRTKLFDELGLIPEHYFLYFEETDWCLKAKQKDHRVAVVPSSQIYHIKRSQIEKLPTKIYFYYYIRASVLFMLKYFSQDTLLIIKSIKGKFVQPWLDKIEKQAAQHTAYFVALAEKALEDGLNGVTGSVDLMSILEKPNHPLYESKILPFYGCIESIDTQKICGWVYNQNQLKERLKVSIYIDGKTEKTVIADQYREELKQLGVGDGHYGFEVVTPKSLYESYPHFLEVFVEDLIPLKSKIVQPFTFKLNSPKYKARIEGILPNRCVQGWALDANNIYKILTVDILEGNDVIVRAKCNIKRTDLLKAGLATVIAGFSIPIPASYCDGKEHSISLRVAGEKKVLFTRNIKISANEDPFISPVSSMKELFKKLYYYREISTAYPENRVWVLNYIKQIKKITRKLSRDFAKRPQIFLTSIIMPSYNREKTIASALESVIKQSYKNWELIIVDDGSTDDTVQVVKEVIKRHSNHKITLIELEQNLGVSAARNVGLAKSQGEVIAYLDSDNSWESDFLLIMVNSLMDNDWFKTAYCGDKIWQHYPGNTTLPSASELVSIRLGHFNKSLIENRNYIDLNVFVHRRELYEHLGGFREDMRRLVDWELIIRYTDFAAPKFVPALLSNYNMDWSGNQVTRVENFDENWIKMKETLDKVEKGEIRKLDRVSQNKALQIIIVGGSSDFDDLRFCLQAIFANSQLDKVGIIVYINDHSNTVDEHQLLSDFQGIANLKLRYSNSSKWSEVVPDAAKQLPEECAMVVLSCEAVVSENWLTALQEASTMNNVGAVVSRQIILGSDPKAQELIPYFRKEYDFDIAITSKKDFILDFGWQDNQSLVRLSKFNSFCVYFNSRSIQTINWQKLIKMRDDDEWISELVRSLHMNQMNIIYTPLSRVFDVSYFK